MGAVSVCHCDKNLENLEEEGYILATISGCSVGSIWEETLSTLQSTESPSLLLCVSFHQEQSKNKEKLSSGVDLHFHLLHFSTGSTELLN